MKIDLEALISYHHFRTPQHKRTYYRQRIFLSKKCGEWDLFPWMKSKSELALIALWARSGPFQPHDFLSTEDQKTIKRWRKQFPTDPHFYSLCLKSYALWNKYKNKTLLTFINSSEAKKWMSTRKKINRKPCYLLDSSFKASKTSALKRKEVVYELIRRNPLIRYQDLVFLKVRNAQSIIEGYPFLKELRANYLLKILDLPVLANKI